MIAPRVRLYLATAVALSAVAVAVAVANAGIVDRTWGSTAPVRIVRVTSPARGAATPARRAAGADSRSPPAGAAAVAHSVRPGKSSAPNPLAQLPPVDGASGARADPLRAPRCPDVELRIVTEAVDPSASLATLGLTGADGGVARIGARVGDYRVAFIGHNPLRGSAAVWLEQGEGVCQALLVGGTAPLPPPNLGSRVRPRSRLRVVPELQAGRVVGLRLIGFGEDSVFGLLGLKSGDVLESINGFELSTPPAALEAYARLRSARRLRLSLRRGGQPLTLTINLI